MHPLAFVIPAEDKNPRNNRPRTIPGQRHQKSVVSRVKRRLINDDGDRKQAGRERPLRPPSFGNISEKSRSRSKKPTSDLKCDVIQINGGQLSRIPDLRLDVFEDINLQIASQKLTDFSFKHRFMTRKSRILSRSQILLPIKCF